MRSRFLNNLWNHTKEQKPPTRIGQPMHFSHPHLLRLGELTPGIPSSEFGNRRKKVMESIPNNSVVIVSAAKTTYFSRNIHYKFKQDTSFLYLTGLHEPEALCVLTKPKLSFDSYFPQLLSFPNSNNEFGFYLFVKNTDANKEMWEGPSLGDKNAKSLFGAEEAWPITKMKDILAGILSNNANIYASTLSNNWSTVSSELQLDNFHVNKDFEKIIQRSKWIKSENEIDLMRKSAIISSNSFVEVLKALGRRELLSEQDIEARFEYEVKKRGAQFLPYPTVVAHKSNATTIHYGMNSSLLDLNEGLILMDGGAEFNGYSSDITRTFPTSGKFSNAERDLYEAILDVNQRCIELCREENNLNLTLLCEKSQKMIKQVLKSFGVSETHWKRFFPHDLSHWLGMDVHDCPTIPSTEKLKPGNIIAVEPGLYFPSDCELVPKELRGLGIRIEDDVLITKGDPEVLTKNAPKTVQEIEDVMRG